MTREALAEQEHNPEEIEMETITQHPEVHSPYTPFIEKQSDGAGEKAAKSLANAFLFIIVIVVMTSCMVALFYFRFEFVIEAWLFWATLLIQFLASYGFTETALRLGNIGFDAISFIAIIFNYVVLGTLVIQVAGPLLLHQFFLVVQSGAMALFILVFIPGDTLWVLLVLLCVWDLIAVLWSKGPLRILVETAKERKMDMGKGIIFSTMITSAFPRPKQRVSANTNTTTDSETDAAVAPQPQGYMWLPNPQNPEEYRLFTPSQVQTYYNDQHQQPNQVIYQRQIDEDDLDPPEPRRRPSVDTSSEESQGMKMGLGDFIFYSVLVGKATLLYGNLFVSASMIVTIFMGVFLTISLLAITRQALPALPISIGMGVTIAPLLYFVIDFETVLSENIVHI